MASRSDSTRGIILAGTYHRADSIFDRLLPRPLVPVAHKPLISYALSWLCHAGVTEVTVCGNRETRALKAQLERHVPAGMTYSYREDPMPRGAAGCVRDAADGEACDAYVVTDGTAVPTGVDLPELLERHWASGAEATVVVYSEPGRGGTPGTVVPVGIYVVNRAALECIPPRGFFDIKEHLIPKLYRAGARVLAHRITRVVPRVLNAQTYLAVNGMAIESLVAGNTIPGEYYRRGEALIHAGASVAADATLIGPVIIGQGADIRSRAVVLGPTSIGCDVVINDGALVSRSAVWRRSAILAGATVDLCIVGDGAVIQASGSGPSGRRRPNSTDQAARVGRGGTFREPCFKTSTWTRASLESDGAMRVFPVFLDFEPHYLRRSGGSLLQTPVGASLLVSRLYDRVRAITPNSPVIVPPQRSGSAYRATMSVACRAAAVLAEREQLIDALPPLETSDVFLFVDPRFFPLDGSDMVALRDYLSAARLVAHHLVAFEASISGTKEYVNLCDGGRVRSIHRYFERATWSSVVGVAASLVPASRGLPCLEPVPTSLVELRQHLVSCGVGCRDIAVEGVAVDLTEPDGLLAAAEHYVVEEASQARAAGRASTVLVGEGHSIAPTARILGPVVIHSNVHIGENAIVIGPALIGAGAQVSSGAIVAHAIVGPQSQVPQDCTLRDRVWFNDLDDRDRERPEPSYQSRLARFSVHPDATSAIDAVLDASPRWHLRWKRLFDVIIALTGVVLLSPVFLLVAILIWLESRGPILYRGEREGLRGRPFKCLKFRTMQVDAHSLQHLLKAQDKLDGPHFKLERDPRLTRVGRILRSTNVDELPQLINVLLGDMSLVGPRPSPFRENQICAPWREGRLSVRPGVTGLWQICRRDRSSGDFHQWIEYDLLYVQQVSPWLDLKILVATVVTLACRVPVPAAWLVRLPPTPRPAGAADAGKKPARAIPSQTATAGHTGAS